jgi:hypothetical protein
VMRGEAGEEDDGLAFQQRADQEREVAKLGIYLPDSNACGLDQPPGGSNCCLSQAAHAHVAADLFRA